MKKTGILILLIITLAGTNAFSQEPPRQQLDVYLQMAAKNNPGLKASFSQYLASLEKTGQVGLADPQLSMDFFLKPMEQMTGNQVGNINLMQMFPWFGTLKTEKKEMALMAEARFNQFQEDKAMLFFEIKSAWYRLVKTRQETKFLTENIRILESIEKLALIRFQSPTGEVSGKMGSQAMPETGPAQAPSGGMAGMGGQPADQTEKQPKGMASSGLMATGSGSMADVFRVRMEILDQKNQLALLADRFKTESSEFNALLNRETGSEIILPDSLEITKLPVSWEVLPDSVLARNPMLKMYGAEQQSYAAMVEKERKMGLPMVGLGINYMILQKIPGAMSEMNGSDMVMPMLNFTLPVYRKKYQAAQKEARLLQESASFQGENFRNSLRVELQRLSQDLNDASRRMELYKGQSELSEKTAALLLAGFSSGTTGIDEILRVQVRILDYNFRRIEATVDYNTSVAKAEKLMNLINF